MVGMEPHGEPPFDVLVVTVWPDEDPKLRVRARFLTGAGSPGQLERAVAAGSEDIVRLFRQWLERYVAESRKCP
jgi:hypothetical protein